jgi:molecular chaperone Hsp33
MSENDILQRFLFEDAPLRGELVHLNESYKTIAQQRAYPPFIRQLLGEALVVACLLTSIIKFKGRLTIQFQSKEKLKLLMAQCDDQFHLRGLVQYEGELTREELLEVQKQGVLAIMIDSDHLSPKRYQGIVAWQGHSLAQAIEGYFKQSEQLETRLWLAVNETSAAGLLLQVLPKEKPELYSHDWEHLIYLTETLTS